MTIKAQMLTDMLNALTEKLTVFNSPKMEEDLVNVLDAASVLDVCPAQVLTAFHDDLQGFWVETNGYRTKVLGITQNVFYRMCMRFQTEVTLPIIQLFLAIKEEGHPALEDELPEQVWKFNPEDLN